MMRCLGLMVALSAFAAAPASVRADRHDDAPLSARRSAKIEKRWGIEIVSLRSAGARALLDLRYRVLDPEKARMFVDRTAKAYMVDQATGVALGVPSPSKLGPMRQTLRYGPPPADRVLFVLFANPGGMVQTGDRVTLSIGDFKVRNLRVQ